MTVEELLSRISAYELTEWKILFKIKAEEAKQRQEEAQRQARGR